MSGTVYINGARIPVTQAVLEDAAYWRAAQDKAIALLAERLFAGSGQGPLEAEVAPGVWEPVGRFGRKV